MRTRVDHEVASWWWMRFANTDSRSSAVACMIGDHGADVEGCTTHDDPRSTPVTVSVSGPVRVDRRTAAARG